MSNKEYGTSGYYETWFGTETVSDPNEIAVITFTRYPNWQRGPMYDVSQTDKIRGELALETINLLVSDGYTIFVDSSPESSDTYLAQQQKLGATIIDRGNKNRSESIFSIVSDISLRTDIKAVFMMEPEKLSLVEYVPPILNPILRENVDFVVPCRYIPLQKSRYPSIYV